ncbi:MAG: purine-nucleoside phosphorylase [Oscillospiraceae bacterium]|nr:purine-nucleoside phosphorylase [Oscillospiraceae bacterium]
MPTPHNSAKIEDIAKTVLMPGDPLRAKFIAETFLTEPRLVNNVRGVQGYTGTWKGVPVTVMASGMGIPSIGIYSWELFNFYNVENIIRIGSAGALQDDLKLRDLVAGQAACTNSNYVKNFGLGEAASFAPIADFTLLSKAVEAAHEHGIDIRVGNLLASDTFYAPEGCAKNDEWKRMGVLAVEMESVALYTNAAYAGKRALCICTISDHIYRPEDNMSAEERQTSFTHMMEVALDTAVKMNDL